MDINNLALMSRILIMLAIFSQIASMVYYKNKIINPYSFLLYAVGAVIMSYVYYKQDDSKFSQRTVIKLVNSVGLLAIGILALPQVKISY
jgi:hypothetical protein